MLGLIHVDYVQVNTELKGCNPNCSVIFFFLDYIQLIGHADNLLTLQMYFATHRRHFSGSSRNQITNSMLKTC
jgi:hypothetical protein